MDISLKKINDKVVVPLKSRQKPDSRPVRGSEMFPSPYPNIGIIARKKSGKTTVVQNIIKGCCGKKTRIIVFSSTYNKDPAWKAIRDWAKKNEINIEGFLSMKEGKVHILKTFIDKLEDMKEEEEEEPEEDEYLKKGKGERVVKLHNPLFDNSQEEEDDKEDFSEEEEYEDEINYPKGKKQIELFKRTEAVAQKMFGVKNDSSLQQKEPYIVPEYIVVFDDLSNELKDPILVSFYKKNRHFKCMSITSTQYIHDMKPEQLKQMDYLLLFRGLDPEKLEKVRRDADLSLDMDALQSVYENAIHEPFCFLYVDRLTETYRKCFDKQYIISS